MNGSEKIVAMAAQLYDMRRGCISILGEQLFREKVEQFKPIFAEVQAQQKCTPMQALIYLMQSCGDAPYQVIQLGGIGVEILEPSLAGASERGE